jgi:hypothetical protein
MIRGVTTRVPSYTDRILVHSMPDKKASLALGPYELCDAIEASDHRPVSTILTATYGHAQQWILHGPGVLTCSRACDVLVCCSVNTGVQGLRAFASTPAPADPATGVRRDIHTVHDSAIFTMHLSNLVVRFLEENLALALQETPKSGHAAWPADKAEAPPSKKRCPSFRKDVASRTEPYMVMVLFPLENEDTFGALRRPQTVAEVAHRFTFLTSDKEQNPLRFFCIARWADALQDGLTVVSLTRPEFGESE